MLVSTLFVAVVIAGAALVPVVWVGWEVRRRVRMRSRQPVRRVALVRSAFILLTAISAVTATAAAVNRHYSYILDVGSLTGHVSPDLGRQPQVLAASLQSPAHGTIEKVWLRGTGFPTRPVYVYLPPAYLRARGAAHRFPVLYLLHGSPGISIDWIRTGRVDRAMDSLLRRSLVRPFIIVMPDFDLGYRRDTQCEDIPDGPQMQTYLTRDVVDYVDAHYRTVADRRHRVIGGFSAGAYCGINLAMRHQDVYSAFVSQSGYTKPDHNAYTRELFGQSARLRLENSPADYLSWIPLNKPLGGYLEAGLSDRVFRRDSAFVASVLRDRGASITFRLVPGDDHTWRDARHHASYMLRWVSSWFGRSAPPRPPTARTTEVSEEWRRPVSL